MIPDTVFKRLILAVYASILIIVFAQLLDHGILTLNIPGYTGIAPPREVPTVNLPPGLRQGNWTGDSCVWASLISLLRWQEQPAAADFIKRNYQGGAYTSRLGGQMDLIGMRYAETHAGNTAFLEWAVRTRRGAGIVVRGGRHMVALVHLDKTRAGILDNNSVGKILWRSREDLLAEWRAAGGYAIVPVYTPPAPHVEGDRP